MSSNTSVTMQAVRAAALAKIPAMIVGPPGVGKTATIRALAKSMGYELITLLGSQMDPTDITGLPKGATIEDANGNKMEGTVYLAPWWQVKIMQKKKVMLFLDEFSNTSASVRASMLTLLQNREFANGTEMPEETIVLGAMNPTDEAADGWDLDKPTTNRIMFLVWKASKADWYEGMLNAWGAEDVSEEEMYWRRLIVRFLKDNPGFVDKQNDEKLGTSEAHNVATDDASAQEVLRYAWSSRRSWDNLSRILSFTDRNDAMLQDEIAIGTVGSSSSIEFRSWIQANLVVSPKEVLDDPTSVDWANVDISEANIIFRGIEDLISPANWRKVPILMDTVFDSGSHSLIASFLKNMVLKTVMAAKKNGRDQQSEARNVCMASMTKYSQTKSPEDPNVDL